MTRPPTTCCPPQRRGRRSTLQATATHVAALKALAHLGRLEVFFHLVQSDQPLAVGDIQAALALPAPTLSHHLEQLETAGLITRRKQDRFIYSQVRRDVVTELVRLLTACC